MSYPVLYDVTYSYTGFQQAQGDNSFPGTQVDADLAGLEGSVESINAFLRTALRSDGKVQNGSVGREAFGPSVFLGFSPPTAWLPNTGYVLNVSTIFQSGKFYSAAVTHTSGSVFDATKWTFIADMTDATRYTTPARSQDRQLSDIAVLEIDASLENVPNDGTADAAARLQEIATWVASNRPYGAFIKCGSGLFRLDSTIVVNGNDIAFGGTGPGQLANFHRNHNTGPLFKFTAPGTGAVPISRSGLRYCAIRDLGTGTNGNGQRTGMFGTWASSPYGVIFETAAQPVLDHVEFSNESLGMFGVIGARPERLDWSFTRVREAGRIAWNFTGGTLVATAFPRGGNVWGDVVDIEAGFVSGGVCYPSCDFGLVVDQADGFYLDEFHCQGSNIAHIDLPSNTAGRPLYNFGISGGFLDIGLGDGLRARGSVPILSLQFQGIASANGFGTANTSINITNPIVGAAIDIDRLDGWAAAGVNVNNAAADNISIRVGQAQNNAGSVVAVNAGKRVAVHLDNVNGVDAAGTGAKTGNGVYLGVGAVECSVLASKITKCTYGVAVDVGATNSSIAGNDLRGNFGAPILDLGTSTNAKGNLGSVNIPVTDVVGPASAVDGTPTVFDGATGKLVKNITYAAFKALLALGKADVGLGNVDNTSDVNKPVGIRSAKVAVNFNAGNTDTAIPFVLPAGFTRMTPFRVLIDGASGSLSTSNFGLFSAPAGGGAAILAAATANTVTTAADATLNNSGNYVPLQTTSFVAASLATPNTIYFRVGTPQGVAATANVTFYYFAEP